MTWQPVTAAVLMSLVAWLLSRTLYNLGARSMARVGLVLVLVTLVMVALGALVFIVIYAFQGNQPLRMIAADPASEIWHFCKLGLLTGFFWLPILVLNAMAQARGVPLTK